MSKNNGVPFVVLYEPLSDPVVKIQVDFLEYLKNHGQNEDTEN
jgi:hypothetical protein